MAALVGLSFAQTFTFARSVEAPYRDAGGAIVTAAIDEPRFDHDAQGNRLGLLIEAGAAIGEHDAVQVRPGDWEMGSQATVMIEWAEAGVVRRRALYSTDVRQTVNACLRICGHLRSLIAVPGYLRNYGDDAVPGFIRYRSMEFPLGGAIDAGDGFALGDDEGRIILESA